MFLIENAGIGENSLFSGYRGWITERSEGVRAAKNNGQVKLPVLPKTYSADNQFQRLTSKQEHGEAGLNHILTVDYFDALGFPRLA